MGVDEGWGWGEERPGAGSRRGLGLGVEGMNWGWRNLKEGFEHMTHHVKGKKTMEKLWVGRGMPFVHSNTVLTENIFIRYNTLYSLNEKNPIFFSKILLLYAYSLFLFPPFLLFSPAACNANTTFFEGR